jgi:hypothetical protein
MISAVRSVRSVRQAATARAGEGALELARRVLAIEADAVRELIGRLDERFLAALRLIQNL